MCILLIQIKLSENKQVECDLVSYLWCEAAREEPHVFSWSVSVSSKLDVFLILIVFFCKKD